MFHVLIKHLEKERNRFRAYKKCFILFLFLYLHVLKTVREKVIDRMI